MKMVPLSPEWSSSKLLLCPKQSMSVPATSMQKSMNQASPPFTCHHRVIPEVTLLMVSRFVNAQENTLVLLVKSAPKVTPDMSMDLVLNATATEKPLSAIQRLVFALVAPGTQWVSKYLTVYVSQICRHEFFKDFWAQSNIAVFRGVPKLSIHLANS